jgi:uncharacterized membrane protein
MVDFKDFHIKLKSLANILFAFALVLPVFGMVVYGIDVEVSRLSGVLGEISLLQMPILPYIAGFFIIGVQWAKYFQLHQKLEEIDTTLLYTNFIYLFFLCLYPFSEMNIEFTSGNSISRMVFSLHWGLLGLLLYLMISQSQKKNYFVKGFEINDIQNLKREILIDPIVALITVPLAYFGFWYWIVAMIVLVPVLNVYDTKRIKKK